MWTHFWDMHSGGGTKEPPYYHIFIEAEEDEAKQVFYNRFGHNPDRISCTCCGEDYSITSKESLAQLTGYHRGCRSLEVPKDPKTHLLMNDDPVIKTHLYLEENEKIPKGYKLSQNYPLIRKHIPLEKYCELSTILVIKSDEIKDEERIGDIPEQGYIWVD